MTGGYEARDFNRPGIDKFYERSFVHLTLTKNGYNWHLVPVHLLNPWMPLAHRIGKTEAGLVMMAGVDNPHFRQVERLIIKLEDLQKTFEPQDRLVLMGDFNVPDEVYGVPPAAYIALTSVLLPVFSNSIFGHDGFSFPAISSDQATFKKMQLDHVFLSRGIKPAGKQIVPLIGSDHYPLEFRLLAQ